MTISADSVWSSTASILCLLLLLLSGCDQDAGEQKTVDILPKEKMVEVMVDMSLIEALSSMSKTKELSASDETRAFYNGVWEKHQVSEAQFQESYVYYTDRPDELSEIFKSVANQIQVIQDKEKSEKIQKENSQSESRP